MVEKQSKKLRFAKEETSVSNAEKSVPNSRQQTATAKPNAKGQAPPDTPKSKPSRKLRAETEASAAAKKKLRFDKGRCDR